MDHIIVPVRRDSHPKATATSVDSTAGSESPKALISMLTTGCSSGTAFEPVSTYTSMASSSREIVVTRLLPHKFKEPMVLMKHHSHQPGYGFEIPPRREKPTFRFNQNVMDRRIHAVQLRKMMMNARLRHTAGQNRGVRSDKLLKNLILQHNKSAKNSKLSYVVPIFGPEQMRGEGTKDTGR